MLWENTVLSTLNSFVLLRYVEKITYFCILIFQALVSVLKINFKKHGTATQRIERGEFAIQDSATTNDVDLSKDWETCFLPGQRVNMSMIFTKHAGPRFEKDGCPSCKCIIVDGTAEEFGDSKTWLVLMKLLYKYNYANKFQLSLWYHISVARKVSIGLGQARLRRTQVRFRNPQSTTNCPAWRNPTFRCP